MSLDANDTYPRPRTPEFSDIPIRYLYVKVDRLSSIREEIEMEGARWRVIEVNYGDNKEFYNANGTMARLTVTPVTDADGESVRINHQTVSFEMPLTPEVRTFYEHIFGPGSDGQHRIRAEVEAMDWPDTIDA